MKGPRPLFRSQSASGWTVLFLVLGGCGKSPPPMEHGVYVWQRNWKSAVAESVRGIPDDIGEVLPLVAEVGFPDPAGPAEILPVKVDREALTDSGRPVTAVIRIGASAARTKWQPDAIRQIESHLRHVRKAFPEADIQIDYDCPVARLDDYEKLLRSLATKGGKDRLSFTALPSWLSRPEAFERLASRAAYFVLQVHALDLPESSASPPRLIDPDEARSAVERAGKIGSPFRVALPTYGSFVVFDLDTGKIAEVVSEDLPEAWPEKTVAKLAWSDPAAVARLVRSWEKRRPGTMEGILWYRLPVPGELLNWPRETWNLVRRGVIPGSGMTVSLSPENPAIAVVRLTNAGRQPEPVLPERIRVTPGQAVESFDGGPLYRGQRVGEDLIFIRTPTSHDRVPLPVGRSVRIGWIRTVRLEEIVAEIAN